MRKLAMITALAAAFAAPIAAADEGDRIRARLSGFQEVPVVSTEGRGTFRAVISPDEQFIDWELTYRGLQGSVTQAHVHVAQRSVNGAIVFWLCGTATNPGPAGTQTCPPSTATGVSISGTTRAADVVVPPATTGAQLIAAGELAEVIAAIRAGVAYANVHTNLSPGGEIRAQLGGHDHDD